MKKFIIVLLTIGLLSCAICIGVSADEIVRGRDIVDSGSVRSSFSTPVQYHYSVKNQVSSDEMLVLTGLSVNDGLPYLFISASSGDTLHYTGVTSEGNYFSGDVSSISITCVEVDGKYYTNGSWTNHGYLIKSFWSDSPIIITHGNGSVGFVPSSWDISNFFIISQSSFDIGSGVSSTLSFSGQVLKFISSNASILALIGLSVGLAIVPFAVVRLKELVKGY